MKREPQLKYAYGVYRYFTFFKWSLCEKCKKEFRREKGWRFSAAPFFGGVGTWRYVCGNCFAEKDRVHKYAINREYITNRPCPPSKIPDR